MKDQKKSIHISGRYFRGPLVNLIQTLHRAGLVSNRRTKVESVQRFIDYSLANDFREGFREREHGFDSHSIATRFRLMLGSTLERESKKQEALYLAQTISACREYIRHAEIRLSELGTDRGGIIFLERQRMIRQALDKIEKNTGA